MALVGYWALFTIEPGNVYVEKQKQKQLEERNQELEEEIAQLKSQLGALEATQEEQEEETETITEQEPAPKPEPTPVASSKYQTLINEIQKLIDGNIFMKEKSVGTRVGTIQTFLSLYFKTSKKVDNDYGAGTKADVIKFQKAVGLPADGETGPVTYKKMIEWLKKQG